MSGTTGDCTWSYDRLTATLTIGAIKGIFVIRDDVERVEARSEQYRAIFFAQTDHFYLGNEIIVVTPENASLGKNSILDGSGQEAGTVVFKNKNIPDYILGDVDGGGEVTIIDATYIQRKLVGLPVKAINKDAADTDGDGEVAILDATYIQRYIAGLSAPAGIGMPM